MNEENCGMTLAVVGDWHGHQGCALNVLRSLAQEGISRVIHVGDFGFDWPGAERNRYETRPNRFLAEAGMALIVSPGNHDNHETIGKLRIGQDGLATFQSNIKILPKGGRTQIGDLKLGGLGGALSVDKAWRTELKDWWAMKNQQLPRPNNSSLEGPSTS